ncbi:SulP family inorganic anion transporter [Seleniivibrio woodruffii]|uniref:SulP family sulfate permease n=2 Tax=Seleniivibrio woodruffii TaxID=1078050 RepID=A0A4R1K5U5_9BACT|nr:sulfate permease [Seleniivibrio woodruffii]TCK59575.1 SulP family sulfate permease [Seleniivibrio woodruffii]TVZ35384.1 SulP family sulfate permease [Seleniivibrio woodruffii]
MSSRLVPQIYDCFKEGYNKKRLMQDTLSGVTVGIVALPLAIAFAIASGVKPEQGLFTAIIAGLLISLLSGSRVQIGGPTGAFIVVVYDIVVKFGYNGLAVATMIAGIMLVAMGAVRLGGVIKFIPYPMTVGFTSGIALIIGTTQIKDIFGLQTQAASAGFIHRIESYVQSASTFNPYSIAVAAAALAIILIMPKFTKKIPGSIIAILITTAAVTAFNIPVATIQTEFGEVPSTLPLPSFPDINLDLVTAVFPSAITIALLAAIESLLSAVVADGMTSTRHRSNMELVGQGVANFFSPLFGGIPATGAIARTATNIKNGATSPVSGIVHAITLLLILMFFGKWAKLIPMPTLAAVLIVVAYHMSEWRHFLKLLKSPAADILIMVVTFLLTVFIDLTVAIETGVVLSALLFMNRMAETTEVKNFGREVNEDFETHDVLSKDRIPDGVDVFEIFGSFFFGAVNQFKDTLRIVKKKPKVIILRMRTVPYIDATAIMALEEVLKKSESEGIQLILSGISPNLLHTLEKVEFDKKIGRENICPHIDNALEQAKKFV